MRKFRIFIDELSAKDWWAIVIFIIMLFLGCSFVPTLGITNTELFQGLEEIYNNHSIMYNIVYYVISLLGTFVIYFIIKVTYINQYKDYYYLDEMYKKYVDFLKNAKEVYIFGGDLDFLLKNREQFELIKRLGSKCKCLCNRNITWEKYAGLLEAFLELEKSGVQIKQYEKSVDKRIKDFRGQLKIDDTGAIKSLFVKRIEGTDKFKIRDTDNQYVLDLLFKDFEECFENGFNAFIEHILFDLGDVFFEGDFNKDFLVFVNNLLNINIENDRKNKLMLDSDLSTGVCTIIKWVEKKVSRRLKVDEAKQIEERWSNVWMPNKEIVNLVDNLSKNYNVTVASNIDKKNGDMYLDKGYLACFSVPLFISYKCGITKPEEAFWMKVCSDLNAKAEQILLIDAHEDNISSAKKYGIRTIKYSNESESPTKLQTKLKEINIEITS